MTWIRLECDFPDHESIGTLSEQLRIDPDRAAMSLVRLWCRFATFQPDGMATEISDTTIEDWAKWRGPRGRFAVVFREYCVEPGGKLAGWWRQEKLLERQERDRRRHSQSQRAKLAREEEAAASPKKSPKNPPRSPPGVPRGIPGGFRGGNDIRIKGSTGSSNELPSDPPPADAGATGNWVAQCIDLWRRHAGEPKAGRLGMALTKPFHDLGIEQLLVALEAWLKAGNARYGPENFASSYKSFLPNDELIPVYDERGEMTPEVAAILRSPR